MPADLLNSEIISFGSVTSNIHIDGGGLGIEYKTKEGVVKIFILEFDEMGMSICYVS